MALFDVAPEAVSKLGAQGYDSALAELGLPNEERLVREVGIPQLQPGDLTHPQPQSVEQGEDSLVNQRPLGCPRVVGQGADKLEQPLCVA